jgi:hypothetical protein
VGLVLGIAGGRGRPVAVNGTEEVREIRHVLEIGVNRTPLEP